MSRCKKHACYNYTEEQTEEYQTKLSSLLERKEVSFGK